MCGRSARSVPLSSIFKFSRKLLLREYIHKSLYDPTHGYFSNKKSPLLQHSAPLRLSSMKNSAEYQAAVAPTYASSPHGWMTPVELFSPYLSRAIANRLTSLIPGDDKVVVIEMGAGRGTLARDILSHWEATDEALLSKASYYIIEISEAMTHLQRRTLAKWIDRDIVKIFNADAVDWFSTLQKFSEFRTLQSIHCHVLGTELLDNMPHDLVRFRGSRLEQAEVLINCDDPSNENALSLEWTHKIDAQTIEAIQSLGVPVDTATSDDFGPGRAGFTGYCRERFEVLIGGGVRDIWIPTATYQLLRSIVQAIPHASLTLGDFDSLPGALPGVNSPVVQSVNRGNAIVFDSVHLAPFGRADIMFPVRFDWLSRGHALLSDKLNTPAIKRKLRFVRRVVSQSELFHECSSEHDKSESTCCDGYNPIIQDFENASFLLIDGVRYPSPGG